jgi:hypothetical protein
MKSKFPKLNALQGKERGYANKFEKKVRKTAIRTSKYIAV